MKLKPNMVMFINFIFRIFLLIYLFKEDEGIKPKNAKPLKHWMDPISRRVFLIFINGLQRDFLTQNSTPYLKEMVENYGSFGVALTGYLETNAQGLRTVLTGKTTPSYYSFWPSEYCQDTILDYLGFKCGIGNIPKEIPLPCYFPDKNPLENFHKFPGLFKAKNYKSSLYMMSFDLDPVWTKDYQTKLKKIDDDIRFLASTIDTTYGDNKTTYIVTAARGSPIGKSLSIDAPVVAWGRGIAATSEVTYMGKPDLTAMLCALLGISFPSGLFGMIPMNMMELYDYYEFEFTLYTIRHFETVLGVVDVKDHLVDSSELELEQLDTRLNHIAAEIKRTKMVKLFTNAGLLMLLLTLWGLVFIALSSSGFLYFFCHFTSLFLLLLAVATTITYRPLESELLVMLELITFWIWQNCGKIYESLCKNTLAIFYGVFFTFTAVTLVGFVGNQIAIPVVLVPVVLWPVINGSYKRLNRFVFLTRLLSGIALGALPLSRVFGEMPDFFFISSVGFLFLGNYYFLLSIFKSEIDAHMKINFIAVFTTIASINLPRQFLPSWVNDILFSFLLGFALISAYVTSGTLLNRLFKIFLSLLIPVLMLSVRIECIFYLSVVFHIFTWIFIEYHSTNLTEFQFYPSIFSVRPKKSSKPIQFFNEDLRHIVFFMIYCHLSYFAAGHFPDLHSYDLYVVPTFVYEYPQLVSYFLGGFKFFLPFFVVTASFITVCALKEKDFNPLISASVWLSDVVGCSLIFYSQFFNLLFQHNVFPAKFSYFFIQQFATLSVILSYFIGKRLLLDSEKFLQKIFQRKKQSQRNS